MNNIIRKVFKNTGIYTLGHFLLHFSALLLLPLYTRYLTPADYGIIGLVDTITTILGLVLLLSLNDAFTRFYFDEKNMSYVRQLLSGIIFFVVLWGIALTLIIQFSGPFLFNELFGIAVPFSPYICLGVWTALASVFPEFFLSFLETREKSVHQVLFSLFQFFSIAGWVVYFVVFQENGAEGSLRGKLYGTCVGAVVVVVLLRKWLEIPRKSRLLAKSIRYSLPLLPHRLAIWIYMSSDLMILQYYRPLHEVGIYSLGYTLGFAFFSIPSAFSRGWVPVFYKSLHEDNNPGKHIGHIASVAIRSILVLTAIGIIFTPEAIRIITVESYYAAGTIVPWVIFSAVFQMGFMIYAYVLYYHEKTAWMPWITGFSALLNVCLNLWLIPKYGMLAAAITTLFSYLVQMILVYILSRKFLIISMDFYKIFRVAFISLALISGCALLPFSPFLVFFVKLVSVAFMAFILMRFKLLTLSDFHQMQI